MLMPLLFGCAESFDLSADEANQISVSGISDKTASSPIEALQLLAAGEAPAMPTTAVAALSPSSLPFVRSRPKLVPPFPLVLNHSVQNYIDSYLAQPSGLRQSFERSGPFMPEMISLFREDGLPPDLVYLAFAESAFSASGAGPWQLSKATAQRYGLTINRWVDERRDPIKSTRAAAEYLAELHDQTGPDWRMTLVAWNNGDGGVYRYLRLSAAPYERLIRHLPRRTRALLNRFMAVALLARNAKQYRLEAVSWEDIPHYHVVAVDGDTSLADLAQSKRTNVRVLRRLNPALLSDCTPPGPQSYPIRVPDNSIEARPLAATS